MRKTTLLVPSLLLLTACRAHDGAGKPERGPSAPPIPGAVSVDHLIHPDETHFAHLWQLTDGGENAEAYWSFEGDRLCLQARDPAAGVDCDRIYVTEADGSKRQVSNGRGTTTCAYFLPGGREVLFASTQAAHDDCPPKPDMSQGYVWAIYPEHDVYVVDLESGESRVLIASPGYDAEATVSPAGDRIVFTSTRSGDIELWTCDLDGSNPVQVTNALGYDGGAFFSHDGTRLVYRRTAFTPGEEQQQQQDYRRLLADWKVRPNAMEIWIVDAGGGEPRQVTDHGRASFAPSFFPDDDRIIYSTNHHNETRNFDLYAIDPGGGRLERITWYDEGRGRSFDGFPLFSPDGRYLVFSSNRGGSQPGETNVFVAEWR